MNTVLQLSSLDTQTFEQMVNSLALEVLGPGLMSFGPGPDGGRDGYFAGTAPYPSTSEQWNGTWYVQSKYHAPHLTKNSHEWLLEQISAELTVFQTSPRRNWPDIWIVATNIDPSGVPETGCFDAALKLVRDARPALAKRFHIWGGKRLLDFLGKYHWIAERYGHFLTPGHVISHVLKLLEHNRSSPKKLVAHLVTSELQRWRHVRLEQAGDSGTRPDIHKLFVELPCRTTLDPAPRSLLSDAALAIAEHFRGRRDERQSEHWRAWFADPKRAQAWLVLAGPGTGKTTLGQFLCQIHRAALLLSADEQPEHPELIELAEATRARAVELNAWPSVPRIPIHVDLSLYAEWYSVRDKFEPRGLLSFIAVTISAFLEQEVTTSEIRTAVEGGRWLVVCDGLDEVPAPIKEDISTEIITFFNSVRSKCDLFLLCTSRPQGYSGQLKELNAAEIHLIALEETQALDCAERLLAAYTTRDEVLKGTSILERSLRVTAIRQLMTTPLQIHIMTIIVRQGQRPPEKKLQLFRRFYEVIYLRESSKSLGGAPESALLQEEDRLVGAVHKALGFVLHARAEAVGSRASLPRVQFEELVALLVGQWKSVDVAATCDVVRSASTNRLVLINTPDSSDSVRFDVRQLQEFFAAEFLSEGVGINEFRERFVAICQESHWREVVHFVLSAVIEDNRATELSVIVDILQWMNRTTQYGDDDVMGATVLAGSMAAAQLLADGVLEPDRRIRNHFRELIRTLGAARGAFQLAPLFTVRGKESVSWLLEVMSEHLRKADPNYAVGASLVLYVLSPVGWREILDKWSTLPQDAYLAVFRLLDQLDLMSALTDEKRFAMFSHPIVGADAGAFFGAIRLGTGGLASGCVPQASPEFRELTTIASSLSVVYPPTSKQRDFGWAQVMELADTPTPDDDLVAKAETVLRAGHTGHYQALAETIIFCARRDRATFLDVVAAIQRSRLRYLSANPVFHGYYVLSCINDNDIIELIEAVQQMSDLEFVKSIEGGHVGRWQLEKAHEVLGWSRGRQGTTEQLIEIITQHQNAADYVFDRHPDAVLSLAGSISTLEEYVSTHMQWIAGRPALWGYLLEVLGDGFFTKLRSSATECYFMVDHLFPEKHNRRVLQLPDDSELLVPVAGYVITPIWRNTELGWEEMPAEKVLSGVRAESARWIESIDTLQCIFNGTFHDDVKMSAALLGMLHIEGGREFLLANAAYIRGACANASPTCLRGFVWCVDAIGALSDARIRGIVDALIQARPLCGWEGHAEVWYSRSVGTVARNGRIATWLHSTRDATWLVPTNTATDFEG